MTYDQVLAHFGTQQGIAGALGLTQPTISAWGKVIPPHYQYQLEIITAGALKVDEELRWPRDRTPAESRP